MQGNAGKYNEGNRKSPSKSSQREDLKFK